MRNTKVRPTISTNPSKQTFDRDHAWSSRQVEISPMHEDDDDDGGRRIINRGASDYWHARRVFLGSYRFSEDSGFKEKLRRSVKEINEVAMGVIVDIRRQVSKSRAGIRVFKVRLVLPTLVLIVRCFTPWFKKVEQ